MALSRKRILWIVLTTVVVGAAIAWELWARLSGEIVEMPVPGGPRKSGLLHDDRSWITVDVDAGLMGYAETKQLVLETMDPHLVAYVEFFRDPLWFDSRKIWGPVYAFGDTQAAWLSVKTRSVTLFLLLPRGTPPATSGQQWGSNALGIMLDGSTESGVWRQWAARHDIPVAEWTDRTSAGFVRALRDLNQEMLQRFLKARLTAPE